MKHILITLALISTLVFAQQPSTNLSQDILGQWQTIIDDMFVTFDFGPNNIYHVYTTSLSQGNGNFAGTYSIEDNVVTLIFPNGNVSHTAVDYLFPNAMLKYADDVVLMYLGASQITAQATAPTNTAANSYVNTAQSAIQHQQDTMMYSMMNDAINQSGQMAQGIAWDISGTSWDYDYGY